MASTEREIISNGLEIEWVSAHKDRGISTSRKTIAPSRVICIPDKG